MMRDVFYIAAVVVVRKPDTIVYYVVTNCGISAYPSYMLLPKMAKKYIIEHMVRASSPADNVVIVGDLWED